MPEWSKHRFSDSPGDGHKCHHDWGEPEKSTIMKWKDPKGTLFLVLPVVRFGNLILAPQPARGWGEKKSGLPGLTRAKS
jgi:cobalamin biosynthesis Mg chelatase CobN